MFRVFLQYAQQMLWNTADTLNPSSYLSKVSHNFQALYPIFGICGGAVSWDTALQAGRSRVPFPMVSLRFFDLIFPAPLWPGVDSDYKRNYQGSSLGGKGGRCVGLTLQPSCADWNSWQPRLSGVLGDLSSPVQGELYLFAILHLKNKLPTCSIRVPQQNVTVFQLVKKLPAF
jgi:hypothetical protein